MATKECIILLTESKESPSQEQSYNAIKEIMAGKSTEGQVGAFLASLSLNKCTADVVAGCARAMREAALPCFSPDSIDIVGTGGDGIDTFNVSTAASIVVAAAGGKVMKHGNRSNSSKCGSADLLEAFGANLMVDGPQAVETLDKAGFCFLFAQKFHPSMKHVGPVRRQLGVRTVFNILGPLTNPCVPAFMVSGVFAKSLGMLYAETFVSLGMKKAVVLHSAEGMDEISPAGVTHCWFVEGDKITTQDIHPSDFGLPVHTLDKVAGGEPEENRAIFEGILSGKEGPCTDYVLLNASMALVVAGMAKDYKEGVKLCKEAIKAGKAKKVMDDYVKVSSSFINNKDTILTKIAKKRHELVNAEKAKGVTIESMLLSVISSPLPPTINVRDRIKQVNDESMTAIMAEIKRASPSKGIINDSIVPKEQALKYANGGAAVISVLTEPEYFKGSIDDLKEVAQALRSVSNRPAVLLKDFVQDEWQLVQARISGADTVLLIVAILSVERLKVLLEYSRKLGMEPLVEAANSEEMKIAVAVGATFIGINNRDLHTFSVDSSTTTTIMKGLSPEVADNLVVASLSGISCSDDVQQYTDVGCRAVLVGEALMKAADPISLIKELAQTKSNKKQKTNN